MVALHVMTHLIQTTLSGPYSIESRKIVQTMEGATGISHPELQRFQNAVLGERVFESFKEERALEIAGILLKAEIVRRKEFPCERVRKNLVQTAEQLKIPAKDILETFGDFYMEIVSETFKKPSR